MAEPFRLVAGDRAPVQQTDTTCGSASLTVARMLADPAFARWVRDGIPTDGTPGDARDATSRDPATAPQRFAAYEQVVMARTNGLVDAGRHLQLPWPKALGTPPWGARHELEHGAAEPGGDYRVAWLRHLGRPGLERAYAALRSRVRPGRPSLLYVGNAWLPRHVVLVMPPTGPHALDVYEPSAGQVVDLQPRPFAERRLGVTGWEHPWAVVWDVSGP
ncbi:hypothetical protein [Terrabacter sp. NPDC080008]|uniref:hypothetical protein n=1 Tax=Terrabacter sp. NPDC080008 TaxID=3155176 RepID=UPI003450C0B1